MLAWALWFAIGFIVHISSIYQVCQHKVSTLSSGGSAHAAFCESGISASAVLISAGPRPVTVRLCLGLLMPGGPIGPWSSAMGAEVDGLR
jgi:hypothetical protein